MQAAVAQDEIHCKVFGILKNESDNQRLAGVEIQVLKNGMPVQRVFTDNLGKYVIPDLELGHVYEIKFNHPDFLSKNVRVDTQNIPEAARSNLFELQFDGSLFKGPPDFNKDVLKAPIAIAKFTDKSGKIEMDEAYSEKRKQDIKDELQRLGGDKEQMTKDFNQLVIEGDAKMGAEKYAEAVDKYSAALKIFPHKEPAESKYKAAKAKLDAENDAKNFEEKYARLIKEGDDLAASEKWAEAKPKFVEASKMKPVEKHPKEMIAECDKNLAGDKQRTEYDRYMADGDKKMTSKFYQPAIDAYKAASKLYPSEQTPKDKIAECEKLINDALAMKDARDKYQRLKDDADQRMTVKKYEEAIKLYTDAKNVLPSETYPDTQIAKANDLIKERDYAILKKKYDDLIAKGDQKFTAKDFEASIPIYEEAKTVLPKEPVADQKIAAANAAIAQRDEAKKRKEYETLVAAADGKFKATDYENAVTSYQSALAIYPNEQYPKDQIALSNKLQAEKLKKENQKAYDDLVAKADAKFKSENYEESIPIYESASALLPSEKYPNDQIKNAQEGILKRDEKKIRAQFDAIVKEADAKFKTDNFEESITKYNEALAVLPKEAYPKDQIEKAKLGITKRDEKKLRGEFDAIVAVADGKFKSDNFEESITKYNEALALLPSEKYPQEQIDKAKLGITKRDEKKLRGEFDALVAEADGKLKSENFEESITKYNEALALLPSEKYPPEQIKKAQLGIAKRDEKKLRAQYDALVAEADGQFNGGSYEQCVDTYNAALQILPDEKHPKDQIKKAMDKMGVAAAEKLKKEQYDALITQADAELNSTEFEKSIASYKSALEILPKETYPKEQIKIAEAGLAELKRKREEYDKVIAKADGKFNTEKWQESIDLYNQALAILPDEGYPKDQIINATGKMDSVAAEALKRQRYDELVADGDNKFKNRDYQNAIDSYQQAADLYAEETYPPKKIDECLLMMAAKTDDVVDTQPKVRTVETKQYKQRELSKYDKYIQRKLAEVEEKRSKDKDLHRRRAQGAGDIIDTRNRNLQDEKTKKEEVEVSTIDIVNEQTYKKGNATITEITVRAGGDYHTYMKAAFSYATYYSEVHPDNGSKVRDLTANEWKRVTGRDPQ